MRSKTIWASLAFILVFFTGKSAYAEGNEQEMTKLSYMNQADVYHFRVETEFYRPNYQGYFDLYYGSGFGMQRSRADKTTVFTFYPHVGVRGYTKVAPYFETGLDVLQIVFLPGKTYDFNYIDVYLKAGVSWEMAPDVGMELSWQRHTALFQKGNPATFVGLSLYVKVQQQ
jgi:hypothetical protein